jgi:hypothetical protein
MKPIAKLFGITLFSLATISFMPHARNNATIKIARFQPVAIAEASPIAPEPQKPTVEPELQPQAIPTPTVTPAPTVAPTPPKDPNGCEAKDMWWRADNFECIPKNKPAPTSAPVAPPTPGANMVAVPGSGSCADEVKKYDWNQASAMAVMMQESGGRAGVINNNPNTGDYSVGCFQINLYGGNAATRPSAEYLQNAANNVAYAYGMWKAQGWKPWGNHTCKVVTCI